MMDELYGDSDGDHKHHSGDGSLYIYTPPEPRFEISRVLRPCSFPYRRYLQPSHEDLHNGEIRLLKSACKTLRSSAQAGLRIPGYVARRMSPIASSWWMF